jgi:3'(2'), 5'-bisphosphate nucleotidase
MNDSFERERRTAIQAVVAASKLCMRVRATLVEDSTVLKRDKSPVTIADYGSQAVICRILQEIFPRDPVVAEEDSTMLAKPANREILQHVVCRVNDLVPEASVERVCSWIDWGCQEPAKRFWTLDPIDGTMGFLRGDQYAVALALIEGGEVQLGVLGCPNLPNAENTHKAGKGALFVAVKGQGAVQTDLEGKEPISIHVSRVASAVEARMIESVESAHADHCFHKRIAQRLDTTHPPLRMDSQAKYAVLARGEASIYLRLPSPETPKYRERIWDHAAGAMIIEEAGGRVTDASGGILDFSQGGRLENNQGVVATNGLLHSIVLQALQIRKTNA